jgi:hypothetical protein
MLLDPGSHKQQRRQCDALPDPRLRILSGADAVGP